MSGAVFLFLCLGLYLTQASWFGTCVRQPHRQHELQAWARHDARQRVQALRVCYSSTWRPNTGRYPVRPV